MALPSRSVSLEIGALPSVIEKNFAGPRCVDRCPLVLNVSVCPSGRRMISWLPASVKLDCTRGPAVQPSLPGPPSSCFEKYTVAPSAWWMTTDPLKLLAHVRLTLHQRETVA